MGRRAVGGGRAVSQQKGPPRKIGPASRRCVDSIWGAMNIPRKAVEKGGNSPKAKKTLESTNLGKSCSGIEKKNEKGQVSKAVMENLPVGRKKW